MQALDLLHNRVSCPKLVAPAPNEQQLEAMFQAAARAPDHANLRPWRLLVLEAEQQEKLGQVFVDANLAKNADLNEAQIQKIAAKPLRAPMVIAVVACIKEHPKVPEIEQMMTAGCAAHALTLAAFAQGFGAMWRSGGMMFDASVHKKMKLADNEKLVGFLYVGTTAKFRAAPQVNSADFVSRAEID